jgi:hypothetical protein
MRRIYLSVLVMVSLLASCKLVTFHQSNNGNFNHTEGKNLPQGSSAGSKQPADVIPTEALPEIPNFSENEIYTLRSLVKVNDYPLYSMTYSADYGQIGFSNEFLQSKQAQSKLPPTWACTLFSALGSRENMLYGRNFDWHYSPTLILFTKPENGYASVSMVDLAYLSFSESDVVRLDDQNLENRIPLLATPWMPFDGMNEKGLAIGMAAVPAGGMTQDPQKLTVDSLAIIRIILDNAKNVEEALDILNQYNIDYGSGPDLHYLIADRTGRAVLVEFYKGKMNLIHNQEPWHLATNFLCSAQEGSLDGNCWRYDKVSKVLESQNGILNSEQAITLLGEVSQNNTQWSILYQITTGQIDVVMGRQYEEVNTFQLNLSTP